MQDQVLFTITRTHSTLLDRGGITAGSADELGRDAGPRLPSAQGAAAREALGAQSPAEHRRRHLQEGLGSHGLGAVGDDRSCSSYTVDAGLLHAEGCLRLTQDAGVRGLRNGDGLGLAT